MNAFVEMEPYSTHLTPTVTAAVRSGILWPELPILELGCGHYSTPILSSIAKATDRELHVVASEPIWAGFFREDPQHLELISPENWPILTFSAMWGMALIDHEQNELERVSQLLKLSEKAKVAIFHDANCLDEQSGIWQLLNCTYKYIYHYTRYHPTTAIFSNHIDPATWFEST